MSTEDIPLNNPLRKEILNSLEIGTDLREDQDHSQQGNGNSSNSSPTRQLKRIRLFLRFVFQIFQAITWKNFYYLTKRIVDILVSLFLLVLLSPLFLLLSIAIRFQDRGPTLFWQKRVGKNGKEFCFPKFRSMSVRAEEEKEKLLAANHHGKGCITFKMRKDPRVTFFGRFLRKFSLDELPQLWCVLKGEMTLVGPRPPLPEEVALYEPRHRRRLEVKPGLTCIWQVSGRGDLPFETQVEMDIRYIQEQGFWLDCVLLAKTLPAILNTKGAY